MEKIAFVGDDTKETTVKIIKTLEQLGGIDYSNYKKYCQTTKNFMIGITVKKLYFFINDNSIIVCDSELPDDYILSDIDIYNCTRENLPTTYDECPVIVQRLVDKKAVINNRIDLDAYANGAQDCFDAISELGIYTEADVLKILSDFKNHFSLYRGIQIMDSDVSNFFDNYAKK